MQLYKTLEYWENNASVLTNSIINFKIIFLSIIIEALPFIMLSAIVSAVLHNFISENMIRKILPRNKLASIFLACFLGIFFPTCDCGTVPIMRRLIEKGVPVYTATAFMLTAPIINPVVAIATSYAFNTIEVTMTRLFLAFFISCSTSWLLSKIYRDSPLENAPHSLMDSKCLHLEQYHNKGIFVKVMATLEDACNEFFEIGKYLIIGACLGAMAQTWLPQAILYNIGQAPYLSVVTMMLFAFAVSVCSSADAFIAASFSTTFTPGALIAFMVFGPMIDVKNTLMMWHSFKPRFVLLFITIVAILCAISSWLINL